MHQIQTIAPLERPKRTPFQNGKPHALDFFAGSGLATEALSPYFTAIWANDISAKKAAVYCANHPAEVFHLCPIETISGKDIPKAALGWASFPCQDLSLAGNLEGIHSSRSGLVWHWLRLLDEMPTRPAIVVAENVSGLVSAAGGAHYRSLHTSLVERGYRTGAVCLNAVHWLPQSRPRVFVIGVDQRIDTADLETVSPVWLHTNALRKAAKGLKGWVWWSLPEPDATPKTLREVIDIEEPCHDQKTSNRNLSLVPPSHLRRLALAAKSGECVFPGYKRIRNGQQVLELRFDGVAGCLRTPQGGSSRQLLVIWRDGRLQTRLLTIRETARLMGVRQTYRIPGSYNDGYKAMGDAVAIPPVRHLARYLLSPLSRRVS